MKIFGVRIMREQTYQDEMRKAEGFAVHHAREEFEYKTQLELLRKFTKANVIITGLKILNPPYFEETRYLYERSYTFKNIVYEVTFRIDGTDKDSTVALGFDDYDVSISDLQRAIQAKICRKECDKNHH